MAKLGAVKRGRASEDRAIEYLKQRGFEIIERNFYAKRYGEIDIIALKGNRLHFIEVKSSFSPLAPSFNLTKAKIDKLINSANYYLQIKNLDIDFTIDALLIHFEEFEYIPNITIF